MEGGGESRSRAERRSRFTTLIYVDCDVVCGASSFVDSHVRGSIQIDL